MENEKANASRSGTDVKHPVLAKAKGCSDYTLAVNRHLDEARKEKYNVLRTCGSNPKVPAKECGCTKEEDPKGAKCKSVSLPELKPCISIKWGDSDRDSIESSDYEVMTITVCNCYKNIRFKDFSIAAIQVVDKNGSPVAILPNGTPSIKVHPLGVYCFGTLEPCSCVTREFVIITEGAKEGRYKVVLQGLCYSTELASQPIKSACFEFDISKD